MSGVPAAAAAASAAPATAAVSHARGRHAAGSAAPGGVSAGDVTPMDESASDRPADEAAAARARKTAAATAAAAAACAQMAAAAKGPYSSMHSCDQVVLLEDWEMWDTIAVNWCKPGKETISGVVDTWEGRDLAACVHKLGLPVLYAKKNYVQHMRRSVVDAALAYAKAHPELFDAAAVVGSPGRESDSEQSPPPTNRQPSGAPPKASQQAESPLKAAGVAGANSRTRSPRSPAPARSAPARSAAAAALAALHDLADMEDNEPADARALFRSSKAAPSSVRRPKPIVSAVPQLQSSSLLELGANDSPQSQQSSDESDADSDSAWLPSLSDVRGRRARDEEEDRQLARAGIQRPFAKGFIANAKFAAGGRSMYQLYKEVTVTFSQESAKRECLALSRVLDALLRGDSAAAVEFTCRRLGGVHTAAETGNWAMCDRLETEAEQRSFVPDAFMRSALKSVVQMQAVKKSAAEGFAGKGARSKGASASGREERRSFAKPNKKGSAKDHGNSISSGAGASHKKKAAGSDSQ